MPIGIIVHQDISSADGGALGAAVNTWYKRKITSRLVNEDSVIDSIDTINFTFDLTAGTYRIEAAMSFFIRYSYTAVADNASAVGVLYNETDALVTSIFSPTFCSNSASSFASTGTPGGTIVSGRNEILQCFDAFTIVGTKTFSFRGAGTGTETWVANTDACGRGNNNPTVIGGTAAMNTYLIAKIIQKI